MANDPAAAPAAPDQPAAQFSWFRFAFQMFAVMQIMNWFNSGSQTAAPSSSSASSSSQVLVTAPHVNLWRDGQPFEMFIYVSESETFATIDDKNAALKWHQTALRYDWDSLNERSANISIPVTPHLLNNGSMWAHLFFCMKGYPHDPESPKYSPSAVIYKAQPLINYLPRPKLNVRKNLITGDYVDERVTRELETSSVTDPIDQAKMVKELSKMPVEYISFWQPSLNMRLLHDMTAYPRNGIPAPMLPHMKLDPITQGYFPPVYIDHFWSLKTDLIQVNESRTELPLMLAYSPISMWKFMMQISMEQSWKLQETWGVSRDGESDDVKRMLTQTDPWLLAITGVVSILHSLFDFLAFKNDIAFWKNNKSVKGISVRSIFINTVSQLIIFLYLLDNETSYMIIVSSGVGLLIEAWKINRAADVSLTWRGRVPWISIKDKVSYAEGLTAKYDAEAIRYLSYAFYPLAIGYAIYALVYREFKSWYSWVLSSAVSFIYMFGFITMCPQLYLNYKLKSVAHLPWRMLTYKFFNTFIDDLFAFVIKMPTLHRLAVFRDDLVFIVYLYQRWKYPVDMQRENEFGFVPATDEQHKKTDSQPIADSDPLVPLMPAADKDEAALTAASQRESASSHSD